MENFAANQSQRLLGRRAEQTGKIIPRRLLRPGETENGIFMIKYEILYSMFSCSQQDEIGKEGGGGGGFFRQSFPWELASKYINTDEARKVDFQAQTHTHVFIFPTRTLGILFRFSMLERGVGWGANRRKKIIFYYYFIHYVYPHT